MAINAETLGKARQAIHKGHSTPRFYDDKNTEDIIGAYGEIAFGELTGCPVDATLRPDGDYGKDFEVTLKFTVDVKTARKPFNLLVKVNEIEKPVDIYVLGKFCEDTKRVTFLGWQWRSVMKKQPTKDFGYGIVNHYMSANELKPMDELLARMGKGERVEQLSMSF